MSKHRGSRRATRRRGRLGVASLALAATAVVAGAVTLTVPQLSAGSATADTSSAVAQPSAAATTPAAPVAPAVPAVVDADVVTADVVTAGSPVPESSGEGRRIVFSQSDQRVWLVGDGDTVERTYLVSGSRFDNLRPGTYAVQSRTRQATAFDYSGTMQYFVRFATGFSEPIGFHSVPRDNSGHLEQTKAQLGTPLSAGCVRQWEADAAALWDFAPVGTTVVVTA